MSRFRRREDVLKAFEKYFPNCMAMTFDTEDEWIEKRKSFLCASDTPCVLGIGFRSNVDIFMDKTSRQAYSPSSAALGMMMKGKMSEDHVRRQFAIDHDEYVVWDGTGIMLVNTRYLDKRGCPFMAATLDGFFVDKLNMPHILEIKRTESWKAFGDDIPLAYRAQVLKQMIVTGALDATLVARIVRNTVEYNPNGPEKKKREVEEREYELSARDRQASYDMGCIIAKETEFWNENILERKMPNLILTEGRR